MRKMDISIEGNIISGCRKEISFDMRTSEKIFWSYRYVSFIISSDSVMIQEVFPFLRVSFAKMT